MVSCPFSSVSTFQYANTASWSESAAVASPASASGPTPLYSHHQSSQCSSQYEWKQESSESQGCFRHELLVLACQFADMELRALKKIKNACHSSLFYAEVLALDQGLLLVAFSLSILHWWKHATGSTAIMSSIVYGCKWPTKACFKWTPLFWFSFWNKIRLLPKNLLDYPHSSSSKFI